MRDDLVSLKKNEIDNTKSFNKVLQFFYSISWDISIDKVIAENDHKRNNLKEWWGVKSYTLSQKKQIGTISEIWDVDIRYAISKGVFKQDLFDYSYVSQEISEKGSWNVSHNKLIIYFCDFTSANSKLDGKIHWIESKFLLKPAPQRVGHLYLTLPCDHPFDFSVYQSKILAKLEVYSLQLPPPFKNSTGKNGDLRINEDLHIKGELKEKRSDKSLLSIITVVFNGEEHIEQTIQSVIAQSYPNIEYIIIDGASTDETVNLIKTYEDQVDYWVSEPDRGLYDAMNKGAALASGSHLMFINAGDLLLHLSSDFSPETSSCFFFNEALQRIERNPLTKTYLCRNTVCHQSIIYCKNSFVPFDIHYSIIADFEQMTRIVTRRIIPKTNDSLVFFQKANISHIEDVQTLLSYHRRFSERLNIVRKNLGIQFSLLATFHYMRTLVTSILKGKIVCP